MAYRCMMKRVLLIHSRTRHETRSGEHERYEKLGRGLATFGCISTLDRLRAWNARLFGRRI